MWGTKLIALAVLVMLSVGIGLVHVVSSVTVPDTGSPRLVVADKNIHPYVTTTGLPDRPAAHLSMYDASGRLVLSCPVRTTSLVTRTSSTPVDRTSIAKLD